MLAWIKRLFAAPPPPPPRLSALSDRLLDVEVTIEHLQEALRATNARISSKMRKTPQDAPEPSNGEEPVPEPTTKRFAPTAHLSRRFRGF